MVNNQYKPNKPKPLAQRIKERNQRFTKGSGSYLCSDCSKRTRETGSGESQLQLCKQCMQRQEQENLESDNA